MFLNLTCLCFGENQEVVPQPCMINSNFIVSARRGSLTIEGVQKEVTFIKTADDEYTIAQKYNGISELLEYLNGLESKQVVQETKHKSLYPTR